MDGAPSAAASRANRSAHASPRSLAGACHNGLALTASALSRPKVVPAKHAGDC